MVQLLEKPFDGHMLLEAVLGTSTESRVEEHPYAQATHSPVGLHTV
jgi:hypothetical protein